MDGKNSATVTSAAQKASEVQEIATAPKKGPGRAKPKRAA
jgi:hypothetical protein